MHLKLKKLIVMYSGKFFLKVRNRNQVFTLLLFGLSLCLSSLVYASEAEKPDTRDQSNWSARINYGFSDTTGNSKIKKINQGFSVKYKTKSWEHLISASRESSEANGRLSKETKVAKYIVTYGFDDKNYIFNFLGYYADKKSKIDNRWMNIIGYERRFTLNNEHKLSTRFGLGVRKIDYSDATLATDEKIAYIGLIYKGKLADTVTLTEELSASPGDELSSVESVTSLNVALSKWLSLELKYKILYRSKVPLNTENRDATSSVSFVLSF